MMGSTMEVESIPSPPMTDDQSTAFRDVLGDKDSIVSQKKVMPTAKTAAATKVMAPLAMLRAKVQEGKDGGEPQHA